MRVLIEMRAAAAEQLAAQPLAVEESLTLAAATPFAIDQSYEPVQLPAPVTPEGMPRPALDQPLEFSFEPAESTYVVRATISDEDAVRTAASLVATHPDVVGVFSDPTIESTLTCGDAGPQGTADDIARLLSVPALAEAGLSGDAVHVAVVDSGINVDFLRSRGREPTLDAAASWAPPRVATTAGQHPVAHGTMCAFDVGIAAPAATLLDFAILAGPPQAVSGVLSDAVAAYSRLLGLLRDEQGAPPALVVTNSWGVSNPDTDFPIGSPSNYTDNPRHPFNVIVASLEAAGADILFSAGNCGVQCPDIRCHFASRPINGANSHPKVLSIGGVDMRGERVGYSSQGPGRLASQKPDVCAYTHFAGSGVKPADTGTSAACPVAAGLVAAVRTKHTRQTLAPQNLRALVQRTARDASGVGFDFDYGWGVVDTNALVTALP
jgi:subtilisin family serine protease